MDVGRNVGVMISDWWDCSRILGHVKIWSKCDVEKWESRGIEEVIYGGRGPMAP